MTIVSFAPLLSEWIVENGVTCMKKYAFFVVGIVMGTIVLNSIFSLLNIPTYDQLLEAVLGPANAFTGIVAVISTGVIIYFVMFGRGKWERFFSKR